MSVIEYLQNCIKQLSECSAKEFGDLYANLKIDFFRKYQKGYIFSTRFGADFFEKCLQWIKGSGHLQPENPKEKLGEYDINFNKWLDIIRKECILKT